MATQDPQMLALLEKKMSSLVGKSSGINNSNLGYVEALPANVQNRIEALRNLQTKHRVLESQFEDEILLLERKYEALYAPLYVKRGEIIDGSYEPTPDECKTEDGSDEFVVPADDSIKGIPEFWKTVLSNTPFNEQITERDETLLAHLIDISSKPLDDNPGFQIVFTFSKNTIMKNSTLTKTYLLGKPDMTGELMFQNAVGTKIEWYDGQDLCVETEIKKQKHKSSGKSRTVKRTVPCESWFNFFTPPQYPENEDEVEDEDMLDDLEQAIEADYEMGEFIKDKVIANAIGWFTGDAMEDNGMDEFDEEDFDEDEDDEDEDDVDEADPADGEKQAAECKQQ